MNGGLPPAHHGPTTSDSAETLLGGVSTRARLSVSAFCAVCMSSTVSTHLIADVTAWSAAGVGQLTLNVQV
jgi:hypothetical protein